MLKLLHIAEIHLDSRFSGLSLSASAERREALRGVFSSALALARNEKCAVVLIAGDLFDSEFYTLDTLDFLRRSFDSLPEITFIIAPGNHDPYNSTSPYRFADFPDNVKIFKNEELSSVTIPELDLTVYGYAFTSAAYRRNPIDGFFVPEDSGFSVLIAHTELDDPFSPYAPIPSRSLGAAGFDYSALGHIHAPTDPSAGYAYSGCIAGRDHGEEGEKGAVLVTLDRSDGKKSVNAKRVRLCPWIYKTVTVPLDRAVNEEEALEVISDALTPYIPTDGAEYLIKLILTGQVGYELETDALKRKLSHFGVDVIRNETVFTYSSLHLDDDFSIRGELYRVLKPQLLSDDPAVRDRAVRALKIGLSALAGCDIDTFGEGRS